MKSFIEFLAEAYSVIKTDHPSSKELFKSMKSSMTKNKNYKTLGKGAFGVAVQKLDKVKVGRKTTHVEQEPNTVYKIARTTLENPSDDPYIQHAKHSMDNHETNPHLPKIGKIKSIKTQTGNVHVVKMEKLHSINSMSHDERHNMWSHAFGKPMTGEGSPMAHNMASKLRYHINNYTTDKKRGINYNESNSWEARQHRELPTHMRQSIEHVGNSIIKANKISPHTDTYLDLHAGNIMARQHPSGETHLVITDPTAARKDLKGLKRSENSIKYTAKARQLKKAKTDET